MLGIVTEIWNFFLIVSPWLILGLFIAGLIHSFIGEEFIRTHLGGPGFLPVLKSTLFGMPLPVCSCSVIPIAAGLRKDGASKASTMSFLVSTPTTGIDSIFVTYAFMGGVFAIARPLSALFAGLLIGMLIYITEKNSNPPLVQTYKHGKHPNLSLIVRLKSTFIYGFKVLPQDMSRTLLLGIVVGGILSAVIPVDFAKEYLSNPLIAYPLMIAISIPIYVCAVGSVPIAAALLIKGLMPGAALAFLIAGPATNTITMGFVANKLGKRVLVFYLGGIVIVAIVSGMIIDAVLPGITGKQIVVHGRHLPYLIQVIATIILLGVLFINLSHKKYKGVKMDYEFHVPDISCKHCQMTIEQAVKKVPGVKKIEVSIDEKLVRVDGKIDKEAVVKQIENAGYSVKK